MIALEESKAVQRTRSSLSATGARFLVRRPSPPDDTRIRALVESGCVDEARRLAQGAGSSRWQRLLAPPMVRATPTSGPSDFVENMAWVRSNRAEYAGQWVALREGKLVEAAADLRSLRSALEEAGHREAILVTRVPA
jgi:hypothetical protein